MDLENLKLEDRTRLLALLPDITGKQIDYLEGRQLGPGDTSTEYWSGPMLPPEHPRYADMQAALLRSFSHRNAISEVVERLADAATADEPDWGMTPARGLEKGEDPTPEEAALATEADAALTAFWDREGLGTLLQRQAVRLVAFGRAGVRFVIPARYLQDGRLQPASTLADALARLRVIPCEDRTSGIVADPDTLDPLAITAYTVRDGQGMTHQELEVSYVDEQGRTVLRVLRDGAGAAGEVRLPLGGRLWLAAAHIARPLVTTDLISQQDALNVALTMLSRNTHFAGFVERYGVGIEQPTDANGNPIPITTGAGTMNFFQPSAYTTTSNDGNGTLSSVERPASATYGRFEPSAPLALTAAIDQAEMNLYAIARQRFVTMADQSTTSGRSREVAAGDYLIAASRTARALEDWLRDVLEFALTLGAVMTGTPERFATLRASVTCRVRAFSPSPDDRAADLAAVQGNLMSRETAMTRLGIPDPDAEVQRIQEEQAVLTPPTGPPAVPATA